MENCLAKKDPELLVFTSDQVLQRVEKMGDLFDPVLKLRQKLPPLESLGQSALESAAQPRASKAKPLRSTRSASKPVAATRSRKAKTR